MKSQTLSRETDAPTSWGSLKPVAEAVKPRGVSTVEEGMLSAACLAADAKYNESVAAYYGDFEKFEAARAHRFDGAETVTFADLAKRRDSVNGGELSLAQKAVGITRDYVGREKARAAEIKVYVEGCEENLATTEASVIEKLNVAGISLESQRAYPTNPAAAAVTFNQQVHGSADWKAANAKLSNARATHDMTVQAISTGVSQAAEAQGYLATVVRRLAGC